MLFKGFSLQELALSGWVGFAGVYLRAGASGKLQGCKSSTVEGANTENIQWSSRKTWEDKPLGENNHQSNSNLPFYLTFVGLLMTILTLSYLLYINLKLCNHLEKEKK